MTYHPGALHLTSSEAIDAEPEGAIAIEAARQAAPRSIRIVFVMTRSLRAFRWWRVRHAACLNSGSNSGPGSGFGISVGLGTVVASGNTLMIAMVSVAA